MPSTTLPPAHRMQRLSVAFREVAPPSWLAVPGESELVDRWPGIAADESPTDILRHDGTIGLHRDDIGTALIDDHPGRILVAPNTSVDSGVLRRIVLDDWFPAIVQYWGWEVLHASAVVHRSTGRVVVFSGSGGSGKSTMAFALSRVPEYVQIADDWLVLEIGEGAASAVATPQAPKLRPRSARHFGVDPAAPSPAAWPEGVLRPAVVYFLRGVQDSPQILSLEPIDVGKAYLRLLGQAFALTTAEEPVRRRIAKRYLRLARTVPCFEAVFRLGFDNLDDVVRMLVAHELSLATASALEP